MMPQLPLFPSAPSSARQDVCVMFADVVGSTRLAHGLPLETYSALMTELLQVLFLGCAARGGEVLQHQGDAVVAIWSSDQAAYALEAASESHVRVQNLSAARQLGLKLQLRIGVASGEVILGTVGGSLTAYGLPMNLARRLCDATTAGGTLTCGYTQALVPGALYLPLLAISVRDFPAFGDAAHLLSPPSTTHVKSS